MKFLDPCAVSLRRRHARWLSLAGLYSITMVTIGTTVVTGVSDTALLTLQQDQPIFQAQLLAQRHMPRFRFSRICNHESTICCFAGCGIIPSLTRLEIAMSGGCLCGAVRYRVKAKPKVVANCHCSMCRKHSGGPYLTYVAFDKAAFELEKGTLVPYRSSEHVVRSHCGTCGSPLTFTDTDPATIWVTLGSLDAPNDYVPTVNGFAADKLNCIKLDAKVPMWSGAPPLWY